MEAFYKDRHRSASSSAVVSPPPKKREPLEAPDSPGLVAKKMRTNLADPPSQKLLRVGAPPRPGRICKQPDDKKKRSGTNSQGVERHPEKVLLQKMRRASRRQLGRHRSLETHPEELDEDAEIEEDVDHEAHGPDTEAEEVELWMFDDEDEQEAQKVEPDEFEMEEGEDDGPKPPSQPPPPWREDQNRRRSQTPPWREEDGKDLPKDAPTDSKDFQRWVKDILVGRWRTSLRNSKLKKKQWHEIKEKGADGDLSCRTWSSNSEPPRNTRISVKNGQVMWGKGEVRLDLDSLEVEVKIIWKFESKGSCWIWQRGW